MIAVCLMTCDRPEYTRETIASFRAMNPDRDRFVFLHADDASMTDENLDLASAGGFQTVIRHSVRCGIIPTRHALIEAASHFAEWVLILENDIQSVRPFPWQTFEFAIARKRVYALRLFGRHKDAARTDPCKTLNQWKKNKPVKWERVSDGPEALEVGEIHWTAQPGVTRVKSLQAFHRKGKRDLGLTMRVLNNVMVHIGAERTARIA